MDLRIAAVFALLAAPVAAIGACEAAPAPAVPGSAPGVPEPLPSRHDIASASEADQGDDGLDARTAPNIGRDGGTEAGGQVSSPPALLLTPPPGCDAPDTLAPDPLTLASSLRPPGMVIHMVDVAWDGERGLVFGAGVPGLVTAEAAGDALVLRSLFQAKEAGFSTKFDRVHVLGGGLVAVTTSSDEAPSYLQGVSVPAGLRLVDTTDPDAPAELAWVEAVSLAGMASSGPYLYVAALDGRLLTFDVTDPTAPTLVHTMEGLASPREVVLPGPPLPVAYVADALLGVVVVDLSDPSRPVPVHTTPTAGSTQDVAFGGGVLFAASGLAGWEAFDLSKPEAPVSLGAHPTGGPVVSVAVAGGWLWAADHAGVSVFDVSDPESPVQRGAEPTAQVALAVATDGVRGFAGDWEFLDLFRLDPASLAPQAAPSSDALYFEEGGSDTLRVRNRGPVPLHLSGASIDAAGYEVLTDRLDVAPGEVMEVRVTWPGEGPAPGATLCLATDDPSEPVREIALASTSKWESAVEVGEPAPGFVLPDIDGNLHALSDHAGRPVVLVAFASWCPVCPSQVTDVEETLWQSYEDEGVMVFGLAGNGESEAALQKFRAQMGLTFPILFDPARTTHDAYLVKTYLQPAPYPQDVIVGAGGEIAYVNGDYDPALMVSILEAELAKSAAAPSVPPASE